MGQMFEVSMDRKTDKRLCLILANLINFVYFFLKPLWHTSHVSCENTHSAEADFVLM